MNRTGIKNYETSLSLKAECKEFENNSSNNTNAD